MSKFKAGDKVFWVDHLGEESYHVVSQVTGEQVWFQNGGWMPEDEVFFEEEALPEVTKVSRYECDIRPGRDSLVVDAHTNVETIRMTIKQSGASSIVALSPETALALSADLLRMALEMKRKLEK